MTSSHQAALAKHRSSLGTGQLPIDQIWTLPWEDIAGFKIFEDCVFADDVWAIPTALVSAGSQTAHRRTVNFAKAAPSGWLRDDHRTESLIRRLKRIAFLNFTQTVPGVRWRLKPHKPNIWVSRTKLLLNAARDASVMADRTSPAETDCPDGGPVFSALSSEAFDRLREAHPTFFTSCVQRLNALFNSGIFDDWPSGDVGVRRSETKAYPRYSGATRFSDVARSS